MEAMNEEVKKHYRITTRDIAGKLNIDETYVFMWLLFKSDFEIWESHVLRSTLCKVTGFKDEETITRYTNKFHELGFLTDKNSIKSYNKEKGRIQTYMTYKINAPTQNWVRFKYDLLEEDIPVQIADAPILEGAISAAVQAAIGGNLKEVIEAAELAKQVSKLE